MNCILAYLKTQKFNYKGGIIKNDDTNEITHIYCDKDILSFVFIAPHSGNKFKYILRVNPTETLDRWSVCDIQKEYNSAMELLNDFDIDKLYKELLEIYINFYKHCSDEY